MSGDTGWLITLCTDGHTGEKKGEEESCPLSAQHPSRIFSLLSLYAFIALCPHWSPLTPTPLPLCSMRDLWVAFRDMPSSRGVDMTGINDISSIYSLSWNAQTNPCTQVILLSNQIKGCQPTHQQHAQIKLINLQTLSPLNSQPCCSIHNYEAGLNNQRRVMMWSYQRENALAYCWVTLTCNYF